MKKDCDHRSVAVIIRNPQGHILLIERARPPWGWAPPAGHVDGDLDAEGRPLWLQAARREIQEEVGITLKVVNRIGQGRKANVCRREDGDWHYWVIFEAETDQPVSLEVTEAKRYQWVTKVQLQALMERTTAWVSGAVTDEEWRQEPGLELVWQGWLPELRIGVFANHSPREVSSASGD